ncbi:MAG: hypothetical protein DLM73_09625 [Chthoniobacterales bacterium]|nr:MAG: hypothetical protein DLM73_09625 [Chthoniobacterales bacterium]
MALNTTRLPPIVPDPVKIKPRGTNTVVHPFDPVDLNASVWFPAAIGKSSVRSPNEVVPYIDGHPAFKDMVAAIRTANKRGHFIYLLGWRLITDFALIPGDGTSTIEALFKAASSRNVDIRAMLYHQNTKLSGEDNTPAITFINSLSNGAAIHDDRVVKGGLLVELKASYLGVHHQKVLIVNGAEGLIAFQGGMDINSDRLQFSGPIGLHDVHVRLRGLAAGSLWALFIERWKDHPQSVKFQPIPAQVTGPANVTDDLQVEIGRTYPNSTKHTLFGGGGPYHFAAAGDQSAKVLVLNAIARAKNFIYIEDQYLFDMSISNALKAALPNLKKLVILITLSVQAADQHQTISRRRDFIDNLTGKAPLPTSKVIVCQNKFPDLPFVHSKTFIFDDKFAIIGSANINRRGYTHDSEQNAGIFDTNKKKRFFFAHELRMHLWAKHLSKRPIDMVDPIASSVHWTKPVGKIVTYVVAGQDPPQPFPENIVPNDLIWNIGLDPDGT